MVRKKQKTTRRPSDVLKQTWSATLETLGAAESEIQRQVKLLLKKNKLNSEDRAAVLKELGARFDKERKRAARELEARLKRLQSRVRKERKSLAHAVHDAVERTLASFNIPSRGEVTELTRKVSELSRKIDSFKRR